MIIFTFSDRDPISWRLDEKLEGFDVEYLTSLRACDEEFMAIKKLYYTSKGYSIPMIEKANVREFIWFGDLAKTIAGNF
jgi:hypothetical protein